MNERIRELALQSNEWFYGEYQGGRYAVFNKEKFAELIIRECASICNDVGTAVWAEQYQSNLGTAQTCKAAIEKHFGVE